MGRDHLPTEALERLDDGFDLLDAEGAGAPDRHRSVRRSVAWSYDALSPSEAAVLRHLSVFRGELTLAAAEEVCGAGDLAPGDVAPLLLRLVGKSLVTVFTSGGRSRYRLLVTVGGFANRELAAAGEDDWVRDRHARWCLRMLEDAEPDLRSIRRQRAFARLEQRQEVATAGYLPKRRSRRP